MDSNLSPAPAKYLVISSSLHVTSRSRVLAREAFGQLAACCEAATVEDSSAVKPSVGWIDLAELPLPLCDGQSAYGAPAVIELCQKIGAARGLLLATPIYNYDVNAALKNLLELTGRNWQDKVVGMMCAAGGGSSYMSLMPFANSLMLDFRCLVLPRFVYATGDAFSGDQIDDSEVARRVQELVQRFFQIAEAVPPMSPSAGG
jgi:NAD(P)H-dependent FMN reductase